MRHKTRERVFLSILLGVVIGLPIIISTYDRYQTGHKVPAGSKIFTLTGTIDHGWANGVVPAWKMLVLDLMEADATPAIIEVNQGDRIVLKLTSNDVVHGFSLKDFGIFVNEGIEPGKPVVVTFVADQIGEFTFSCNAICGKNHETMRGILRVRA
jgi:heme/copper-type cytochrome/quinol oxidase subunit 2